MLYVMMFVELHVAAPQLRTYSTGTQSVEFHLWSGVEWSVDVEFHLWNGVSGVPHSNFIPLPQVDHAELELHYNWSSNSTLYFAFRIPCVRMYVCMYICMFQINSLVYTLKGHDHVCEHVRFSGYLPRIL